MSTPTPLYGTTALPDTSFVFTDRCRGHAARGGRHAPFGGGGGAEERRVPAARPRQRHGHGRGTRARAHESAGAASSPSVTDARYATDNGRRGPAELGGLLLSSAKRRRRGKARSLPTPAVRVSPTEKPERCHRPPHTPPAAPAAGANRRGPRLRVIASAARGRPAPGAPSGFRPTAR